MAENAGAWMAEAEKEKALDLDNEVDVEADDQRILAKLRLAEMEALKALTIEEVEDKVEALFHTKCHGLVDAGHKEKPLLRWPLMRLYYAEM